MNELGNAHKAEPGAIQTVAIFIDYENVRRGAKDAFLPRSSKPHEGVVDPVELARVIVGKRSDAGLTSELAAVWVFRGKPNTNIQPKAARAFQQLAVKWSASKKCILRSRDLRYLFRADGSYAAQEKGIDVDLAVTAIRHAIARTYDVIVIFSNDTDLLPAVEFICDESSTHVEVAAWAADGIYPLTIGRSPGGKRRPYCHYLNEDIFRAVRDD